MRVGIDARLLAAPITGIGRYIWQLSRELFNQDGEFFLYMPGKPTVGTYSAPNVHIRSMGVSGRAGRVLWSQTVAPWLAARDRVDVFWGGAHRLPHFLPSSIARVVTIHDLVWKHAGETMRPLSRWMEQRLMPEAVRLADRIVADSYSTAQSVEDEFPFARGKVRVIHLGVTPMPAPEDRGVLSPLGVDRPYFLFVGTLEPRKNLRRLLGAFARLPESIRDGFQLVIAGGGGWGGVDVAKLAGELGISRSVVVSGYVDDARLATLYTHARFLAMPSLYEGFGLPLVEAMSCGVPVLTSNVSSLPEVAGDAGLLVDPLDEDAIARGLLRLLTENDLREDLARRAKGVAARFSWAKAARETWAVFEEARDARRAHLGRMA